MCQGKPDYACKCDIGWYGDDCSKNCGCNNHSACPEGKGICSECVDNTEGDFCELCQSGSYGNATTEQGKQLNIFHRFLKIIQSGFEGFCIILLVNKIITFFSR